MTEDEIVTELGVISTQLASLTKARSVLVKDGAGGSIEFRNLQQDYDRLKAQQKSLKTDLWRKRGSKVASPKHMGADVDLTSENNDFDL